MKYEIDKDTIVAFNWEWNRLFDKLAVFVIYETILREAEQTGAKVSKVT